MILPQQVGPELESDLLRCNPDYFIWDKGVVPLKKLKVLLADNSVITRMAVVNVVNTTDYGMIEHAASNGSIAFEWLRQCHIDVLLLDVMIIKNEGLELLKRIKADFPGVEIIVMSSDHPESPAITLDSLRAGAMDFIQKPTEKDLEKSRGELKAQMNALFSQIILGKFSDISPVPSENKVEPGEKPPKHKTPGSIDLILIASSTGGPVALDTIFSTFPPAVQKPILVVQHMPPEFTDLMAQTLNKKYRLNIYEGKENDILSDGQIIVAPGGRHMTVEAADGFGKVIRLLDTAVVNGVKPSADVLFHSVAEVYKGKNILAVILTGMGNDGTQGVLDLKRSCNCYCITQTERSCVVYGMPKCVCDAGLSDEAADLKDIAYRIHQVVLERV